MRSTDCILVKISSVDFIHRSPCQIFVGCRVTTNDLSVSSLDQLEYTLSYLNTICKVMLGLKGSELFWYRLPSLKLSGLPRWRKMATTEVDG